MGAENAFFVSFSISKKKTQKIFVSLVKKKTFNITL